MTIAELIASRESDWKELEALTKVMKFGLFSQKPKAETIARFTRLYRAACDDLATAASCDLPQKTVEYLNSLVQEARSRLYCRRRVVGKEVLRIVFLEVPRWVITDPVFWVAFALFWIPFGVCSHIAQTSPDFAKRIVGEQLIDRIEDMYAHELGENPVDRIPMTGWYLWHNGGIGLRTFALSLLGCFPGVYALVFNSTLLGCVDGYMASSAVDAATSLHFREFTLAHSPFELTAIVLSVAAGMRIGFSWIDTRGYSRLDSFRRASIKAAPTAALAFIFFGVAATIEALVSPNPMPSLQEWGIEAFSVKTAIRWISVFALIFYFVGLGCFDLCKELWDGRAKFVWKRLKRILSDDRRDMSATPSLSEAGKVANNA